MAKKRGNVRTVITLQCNDCSERNYTTEKNKRNSADRLELKNSAQDVDRSLLIEKFDETKR